LAGPRYQETETEVTYLDPTARGASQATTVAALTAASGTADGTVADVGSSFNQTTLNNNFQDLATKINEIRTSLRSAGIMA
jgi:hypothetical protein